MGACTHLPGIIITLGYKDLLLWRVGVRLLGEMGIFIQDRYKIGYADNT